MFNSKFAAVIASTALVGTLAACGQNDLDSAKGKASDAVASHSESAKSKAGEAASSVSDGVNDAVSDKVNESKDSLRSEAEAQLQAAQNGEKININEVSKGKIELALSFAGVQNAGDAATKIKEKGPYVGEEGKTEVKKIMEDLNIPESDQEFLFDVVTFEEPDTK